MSDFGWFLAGVAVLSLASIYTPRFAGPFVLLILTVLAFKLSRQGVL